MTRTTYYGESLAESTHTGDDAWVEKLSLSFTCEATKKYLIIASWAMKCDKENVMPIAQMYNGSSFEQIYLHEQRVNTAASVANYVNGFGMYVLVGEDVGNYTATFKINYKIGLDDTATVSIKNARIFVLELETGDEYDNDNTVNQTTNTDWTDTSSVLTFTPASQGDYVILAFAEIGVSSMAYDCKFRLLYDSTPLDSENIEADAVSNYDQWGTMKKINLTAAEHTFKIQYCSEDVSYEIGAFRKTIVALRASLFDNVYYSETEDRSTTTETTYQDKTTLTQTPTAEKHLIIGCFGYDGASESYQALGQLIQGETSKADTLRVPKDSTTRHNSFLSAYRETLSAESTTWKLQYKTSNASGAAGIQEARICVIQLESTSGEDVNLDMTNKNTVGVMIY